MNAYFSKASTYTRPTKRLMRIFNKGLGPLPDDMPNLSRAKNIQWDSVPQYRLVWVLMTIACVVATTYGVWFLFDWTHFSVVTAVISIMPVSDAVGVYILGGCMLLYFFGLMRVVSAGEKSRKGGKKAKKPTGFLKAALSEELWFRSGCETWPWYRRAYSCVFFGLVHLYNLVVPVAVTIALMLGGAVMMVVYLREYRKTGSSTAATLASGLFHRDYNDAVIGIVLPLFMVVSIIRLLVAMF
ncbi:MAG TPA: hypothetical protein PK096_01675 [Candidatus Saccharibacteria bacterium]|nr:hypothetical protein [Candidatus Saccharibacteria bacterium]